MLSRKRILNALAVLLVSMVVAVLAACQTTSPQKPAAGAPAAPKATIGKLCLNCHDAEQGSLRGNFESVAYKTRSIQIRIDDTTEIVRFDQDALKVVNVKTDEEYAEQPLRAIPKGKEVRVEYMVRDGKKVATLVVAKPPISVPAKKQMSTEEVEKLVALGPEKGKYTLVDARPPLRFQQGTIPTAMNIPFAAFDKMADKLPKEKDALIVYFCQGVT